MEIKVNEIFYPQIQIDRESYAITSGWNVLLLNQVTNIISDISATVTEAIRAITAPRTSIIIENAEAGAIEITVSSVTSALQKGDVFSDLSGNVYYIDSISMNKLVLREVLRDPINTGDTLLQVGNTAVYSCGISIGAVGKYSVIMQNPIIGASYSLPYIVIAHSIEDVMTTLNSVKTTVEAIATQSSKQAFV